MSNSEARKRVRKPDRRQYMIAIGENSDAAEVHSMFMEFENWFKQAVNSRGTHVDSMRYLLMLW